MIIVFISLEPWDEIWRRNQFLCDGLLRISTATCILFVQPPFDNSHALRTRNVTNVHCLPRLKGSGYAGRLQLFTPTKWFPNSLPAGRRLNEKLLTYQIRQAINSLSWVPTHLWINQHEAAHLLSASLAPRTVYDITDDWSHFVGNQSQLNVLLAQDDRLCRQSDDVIVCSQQLFTDKSKIVMDSRLHHIPNGVHVSHYESVTDNTEPESEITQHWSRPVFGYTGTIHGERVDVGLVAHVARAFPCATIALVGPNLLDNSEMAILDDLKNVVFSGPQPYCDLPGIMRAFDVCMVPHLVTPFTESLNPIKLWEYLASGKPIVSTNVAGFRDYPSLINISKSNDEFVSCLRNALSEDLSFISKRKSVASQHSWDSRIDHVLKILRVDR